MFWDPEGCGSMKKWGRCSFPGHTALTSTHTHHPPCIVFDSLQKNRARPFVDSLLGPWLLVNQFHFLLVAMAWTQPVVSRCKPTVLGHIQSHWGQSSLQRAHLSNISYTTFALLLSLFCTFHPNSEISQKDSVGWAILGLNLLCATQKAHMQGLRWGRGKNDS